MVTHDPYGIADRRVGTGTDLPGANLTERGKLFRGTGQDGTGVGTDDRTLMQTFTGELAANKAGRQ